ncbi:MAG: lipoate-protein ligase B [Alphaproteobacteria bacterium BRH_c36]|nr:MAG: lipoate-protein ligase B [Alphaproteobacteria bacterium BRH_c36]
MEIAVPVTAASVQWLVSRDLAAYPEAVSAMEARVASIASGEARELIWLVEHPPLYTAGTSAKTADLIAPDRFPVFQSGRGGQYTYHGPGQRVAYVMLDVRRRFGGDVRAFVRFLEGIVIETLSRFGIKGELREGRVGVWVTRPSKGIGTEDKIAALGIRIRRGVSFHGISINVAPNLVHFSGIVPCGISEHGVTSLADLGLATGMGEVDAALREVFTLRLGAMIETTPDQVANRQIDTIAP